MNERTHARIVACLQELDRALADHAKWMARVNRQLICGGEGDADDLAADAHQRCAFGTWFHGAGKDGLEGEADYAAIAAAHESMHSITRHLLLAKVAGAPIAAEDYDALVAVAARFRQLLRQLEQRLMEHMGAVDKLTGVWNRQAVHLRLLEEVERIQRTRQPCTLCYVDLDDFARHNELLGQKGGDELIQSVAAFFKARLRGYDTLFRVKGEEFLLCLPNTDLRQAAVMINRLREELAATSFSLAGGPVRLTASIGVVPLDPVFFIDETLEQAERAQIIAQRRGGNSVCVWHEGPTDAQRRE
ncbi:MAG TPA: diguanylate cyclase [Thiobacillaceae bacterium]|nr:diguanylate cyclase [Thiobacillaceae bacterium]HNU65442.1 diguanylate cyclase [Thiobacillaceae bacterium]